MQTYVKDNRLYTNISELTNWEKNPRNISVEGFERLKKQVSKLGQHKPLLITAEGEVLGGNMRLRAYNELAIQEVWVNIVEPKDENEKLEYALSDNDRAGFYDDAALMSLMPNYDINWDDYGIDTSEAIKVSDLLADFEPVSFNDDNRLDQKKKVKCPICNYEFET